LSVPRISVDLDALAGRYGLPPAAVDQLRGLVEAVASDPLAPTAIRDPDDVLRRHVADSLVALELPLLTSPIRAVDLGSGAGFPGLVLAVARPDSQLVLLESTARKCEFIERTAAACSISNVDVVQARAEAWPDGVGRFDVATARALGSLPVVLEYAAPLLRLGGSVIAWRGRRDPATEAAAAAAAAELGLELGEVRRVVPFPGAEHRHLHLARKIAETPPRFPRRAGMAAKRPLGSRGDNPSDRARR
jgi:16S rRNA (guanine527-N7)-methyltransferase